MTSPAQRVLRRESATGSPSEFSQLARSGTSRDVCYLAAFGGDADISQRLPDNRDF